MNGGKKRFPIRVLAGALLGAVLAPGLVCLGWGSWIGIGEGQPVGAFGLSFLMVFGSMASAFGSAEAAAVVQSLLGALLGGVVTVATLPFAENGKTLVRRSLLHFLATQGAFLLLILICRWANWGVALLYGGLLALLYLLIWLGRWTGWYLEVVELRELLGLDPGPTPLKWRETLPYLPLVLLMCLGVPLVLRVPEYLLGKGFPALSGIYYPFLVLPVVSLCVGVSLGKRRGVCPLYPAACLLCCLPMTCWLVFTLSTPPYYCLLSVVPALAGNLGGWLWRRRKESKAV